MSTPRRVPTLMIPDLPDDVRPFADKDLLVQTRWIEVGRFDLDEIVTEESTLVAIIDRFTNIANQTHVAHPTGTTLTIRCDHNFGDYESPSTVYMIGYDQEESDEDIRTRLNESRTRRIAARERRKQKFRDEVAARARVAALQTATAQTELELVQALAAKHGLTLIGPVPEVLTDPSAPPK